MSLAPYHPVFALLAFVTALLCGRWLLRWLPTPASEGRFASIDGLRGYLAFAVFVHHAAIWFAFSRTGSWALPPSALYTHFGQSGVALFFMITGFLFFGKLLDARTREEDVDWLRLYVSRVLRLVPLYLAVVGAMALCVLAATDWELRVPLRGLLRSVAHWGFFTMLDEPLINAYRDTHLVVAGVVWSLPYEWTFYLCLPLVGLVLGLRVPWGWRLLALAVVVWACRTFWQPIHLTAFGSGMLAAWLARQPRLKAWAERQAAGLAVLACLCLAVWVSDDPHDLPVVALLTSAFCLIAAGNTVFGLLRWEASRRLGEIAYGIYLLHGLVLFVALKFVVGEERVISLEPWVHWGLILGLTPILLSLAGLGYVLIERPALQATNAGTALLRRLAGRTQPPA